MAWDLRRLQIVGPMACNGSHKNLFMHYRQPWGVLAETANRRQVMPGGNHISNKASMQSLTHDSDSWRAEHGSASVCVGKGREYRPR
jgi:hypothetical protein